MKTTLLYYVLDIELAIEMTISQIQQIGVYMDCYNCLNVSYWCKIIMRMLMRIFEILEKNK